MSSKYDTVKAVAFVGLLAGLGYAGWRAYQRSTSVVDSAKQSIDETTAAVSSWWRNNVADPFNGVTVAKSEKEPFLTNYAYSGIDPGTGQSIMDGEWYSDAEARRYDYTQRAAGGTPPATSIDGAAFGIYPAALAKPNTLTPTQAMVRRVDVALGY